MAHEIHEHDNLILTSQPAWHGLGHIFDSAPTLDEAVKVAFPWEPQTVTVRGCHPDTGMPLEFPDNKILGRVLPDGRFQKFGIVSSEYEVLHNQELFERFRPLIESGSVTIESAGSFFNGKICFVSCKLANSFSVRGDQIDKYVLLNNGHACSKASIVNTTIRVVCNNTLTAAMLEDGENQKISVKHTKNIRQNLDKVIELIDLSEGQFKATQEQFEALTTLDIDQKQLKRYVKVVFSIASLEKAFHEADTKQPTTNKDGTERESKIFNKIEELFVAGQGNKGKDLWDAYNAVTEYLTWNRGNSKTTQEDRTYQQLYGNAQAISNRALEAGLLMVAGK